MAVSETRMRRSPGTLLDAAVMHVVRCNEELRTLVPDGTTVVDVHTHLGADEDGMVAERDELLSTLETYRIERAFVFCLNEPDRHPGFRAPNDRTLAHAARSRGRLVPFARLDVEDGAVSELRRCLAAGAGGIKLHPRAQRFPTGDPRIEAIFAIAGDHRIPILIHGGHGLPPIAAELERLVDQHGTQLIIAHAGVADMENLTSRFAGRPGVYFDTSVWSPLDVLALLARIPPQQVLYGSDYPYGQQPASLYCTVRAGIRAGLDASDLTAALGGSALRMVAGGAPLTPRVPRGGHELRTPLALARVHQCISMAAPMLWSRRRDSAGALGQAIGACGAREHERVRDMLDVASRLWRGLVEVSRPEDARTVARTILQLLQLADVLAVCG